MAKSYNHVTLLGNLVRDPEVKYVSTGQAVCNFTVALNRNFKDKAGEWQQAVDYVDCVAWGPLATKLEQFCKKGKQILVTGRLQTQSWEQKGEKRSKLEVFVNDIVFLNDAPAQKDNSESQTPLRFAAVADDIGDDPINLDDIPF